MDLSGKAGILWTHILKILKDLSVEQNLLNKAYLCRSENNLKL